MAYGTGIALLNFGDGLSQAQTTISNIANFSSDAVIEVLVMADTTSDHDGIAHAIFKQQAGIVARAIDHNNFEIIAVSSENLHGKYQIRYAWNTKLTSVAPDVPEATAEIKGIARFATAEEYEAGISGVMVSPNLVWRSSIIQNDVVDPYYWSSTSNKEITPLTTRITPKAADRKILIIISIFYETPQDSVFRLYRDGIELSIPKNAGARRAGIMGSSYDQNQLSTPAFQTLSYLDMPNTDQAVTYRLFHEGQVLALNRTLNTSNSAGYERGTSRMILMEV